MSNEIASQAVHTAYGGVVPELASRAHQQNIVPVVDRALKVANIEPSQLDAIAFTNGPGLMGSLMVGTSFAKSLALTLDIPLIPVHHMHAHILAHAIEGAHATPVAYPFLCLTVSGGHTQLVRVDAPKNMAILGETIDDAVGEAFDKAAKILGLPYPGGPHIDRLAKNGDDTFMEFNRSNVANYDYSFSGMKTSFLYALQKQVKETPGFIEKHKADICASYQRALLDVLFDKLEKAIKDTGISNVALAGGVSANSALRKRLHNLGIQKRFNTYVPPLEYTTDNAAMIGIAGYYNYRNGEYADLSISSTAKAKF